MDDAIDNIESLDDTNLHPATIFRRKIYFGKDESGRPIYRYATLRFPPEYHTITHGGSQPITQAGIAEINLLSGKWSMWLYKTSYKLSTTLDEILDRRFQRIFSGEMKSRQRDWVRVLKMKKPQEILKRFKSQVQSAKAEYERLRGERDSYPSITDKRKELNASIPTGLWGYMIEEWIDSKISEFKLNRNVAIHRTREARAKYLAKNSTLRKLKEGLVRKYSPQRRIEEYEAIERLLEYEHTLDKDERAALRDQYEAIRNPWAYGATQMAAAKSALEIIRVDMVNAILGAKAPDITPRTKKNRESRGMDSDIPLAETGEFAESLEAKLI